MRILNDLNDQETDESTQSKKFDLMDAKKKIMRAIKHNI